MGRTVVTEFISIDGVIQDPGGAEGTKHGGWSFAVSRGADGDKFKLDETLDSEALLLVDELRLMIYPFVLGDGQRLFGETPDKLQLRLAGSQTVGEGVVINPSAKP